MVATSKGLGPENDFADEDQQKSYTTGQSSRQRECPKSTNPRLSDSNKNLVVRPRWVLYSMTYWSTDRRSNIRLRLSLVRCEIYGVGNRYQATTGEHTAVWEDFVRVLVHFSVCELVIVL
jgi:hypothetical protein